MNKKKSKSDNDLDYYLLHDQPMTCGKCGSRTSFIEMDSGAQKHQCLNADCGYAFLAEEDLD